MKICFVIYSLGNGGAERVLSTLSNHFIKTNEVTIVTFKNDESYYELDKNIIVKSIDSDTYSKNIFIAAINNIKKIKKITKILKLTNPDVVISFMTTSNILATISCKIIGKPIVISERTNYDVLYSKFWQIIRKLIYPFSSYLVVQSNYDLNRYNFVKKIKVIYNPLFFKDRIANKKRQNFILAVGRLDRLKGFDMLIEAYSSLDTDWKLKIVGEGNERINIEKLIADKKLEDRVILLGRKSNLISYYQEASLFVLSSRQEGFPNVLCEAMACGCPSVAFDCNTGPSNMIEDGLNGLLVEDQNIDKLALAMQKLINDKKFRDKLSLNGKMIKDSFDIENIASQWMKVINKIVGK